MNKFAICDDDRSFAKLCEVKIANIFDNNCEIVYYDNCKTVLEKCFEDDIDVYFIDIEYGTESGHELARRLHKIIGDVGIVFITNHNEYVIKSFVARPLGFVRKGNLEEDLLEYKRGILEFVARKNKTITLKDGKNTLEMPLNSIMYINMNGHYMELVCTEKTLEIRDKISRIEETLCDNYFIKINRSCLVNARYIDKINGVEVQLINSKLLYASEEKKKTIMLEWQKYVMKC